MTEFSRLAWICAKDNLGGRNILVGRSVNNLWMTVSKTILLRTRIVNRERHGQGRAYPRIGSPRIAVVRYGQAPVPGGSPAGHPRFPDAVGDNGRRLVTDTDSHRILMFEPAERADRTWFR
jgi:hypothetical protein